MASLAMIEKHNLLCHCEGWMFFPARSNPPACKEIASLAEERLLATTFVFLKSHKGSKLWP